jgi:DNA-binding MarR family transcriptional regulator
LQKYYACIVFSIKFAMHAKHFKLMNIKDTFDFHIRSILFSMMRMYNLMVQDKGITQGIGYTLIIIPKEGIPATSIAPAMGMSSSSLVRLLKSMENQDLIYRKSNQNDRRVTKIFLTAKGVELRKEIKKMVVEFNKQVLENISTEDHQTFLSVSEKIKRHIEIKLDSFHTTKQ